MITFKSDENTGDVPHPQQFITIANYILDVKQIVTLETIISGVKLYLKGGHVLHIPKHISSQQSIDDLITSWQFFASKI